MESNKVISSLCYFSIFFAGFIFPIAVYFIADNPEVRVHAKSALMSHLIPILSIPLVFLGGIGGFFSSEGVAIALMVFIVIIVVAINLGVTIWNIVKGIKVLRG